MTNNRNALLSILFLGIVFQAIFYNHGMGLNTLVFTALFSVYLFLFRKQPQSTTARVLLIGLYAATLGVVFGHTAYSLILYWLVFILLLGAVVIPSIRFMHYAPAFAFNSVSKTLGALLALTRSPHKQDSQTPLSVWIRFIFLPIVLFFILLVLYAASNSYFNDSIARTLEYISELFDHFSAGRIMMGFIGIFIGSYFLLSEVRSGLAHKHLTAQTELLRTRTRNRLIRGLSKRLFRKQQVAVVFFILINCMAAWLNILDIKHVWFGFVWDGGFLKEMVHEGTYLLIAAILISMGIALYYLNGNLVFLKKHQVLQTLVTIWLAQNILMVISVVFRNTYYIQYFGLAYKRIFVYFFLAACVVGLISIMYKSLRYKSATFLFSVNTLSVYGWCILAGLFNWDAIIARYNFNHYQSSFVHYEFLVDLNNASLPYIITDEQQLKEIDSIQTQRFSFSSRDAYKEMKFTERMEQRKQYFTETWETKNWLDWNYPEAKAYELLKK
jgi:hypothetical protein